MKKTIIGLLAIGLSLAGGGAVFADDQNVVSEPEGEIGITGYLGADNTKSDAGIPEGNDDWINVTLPTATIFYNMKKDTEIKSPEYTIKNNSGRGVAVSVKSLALASDNTGDITKIADLKMAFADTSSTKIDLLQNGVIKENPTGGVTLSAAVDDENQPTPANSSVKYTYTGAVTDTLTEKTTHLSY